MPENTSQIKENNNEKHIRILTRDSFLALAQTLKVSSLYFEKGYNVSVIAQKTSGDVKLDAPLYEISQKALNEKEGKAFFTKELEDGLLSGEGQMAVHSLKDLPTELPPGLILATPAMEETGTDTIVSPKPLPEDLLEQQKLLDTLRIGTSSLRRIALVREYLPNAEINPVRGNLITRMKKLLAGESMDALILATAGLKRLFAFHDYWHNNRTGWLEKLDETVIEKLDLEYDRLSDLKQHELHFYEIDRFSFLPAVCQGVLGIESGEKDAGLFQNLHNEDETLLQRVYLERKLLSSLEAGCHIPMGISVLNNKNHFAAELYFAQGFNPDEKYTKTAFRANRNFLKNAAKDSKVDVFISEIKGKKYPVVYCGLRNEGFEKTLTNNGFDVLHVPLIKTALIQENIAKLDDSYDAVVMVSKSVVNYLNEAGAALPNAKVWVAAGEKTGLLFQKTFPGKNIVWPAEYTGLDAANLLKEKLPQGKIAWVGAKDGNTDGIELLSKAGYDVHKIDLYETQELNFDDQWKEAVKSNAGFFEKHSKDSAEFLENTGWWAFSSPSSARAYLNRNLYKDAHLISVIGSTTQKEFTDRNLTVYHKSSVSDMIETANEIMGLKKGSPWVTKKWRIQ